MHILSDQNSQGGQPVGPEYSDATSCISWSFRTQVIWIQRHRSKYLKKIGKEKRTKKRRKKKNLEERNGWAGPLGLSDHH